MAVADFTLDTSGRVTVPEAGYGVMYWADLTPFAQGYIEAAFASLYDAWKREKHLKVGDKVRVHTGEVGRVAGLDPTRSKKVHVLFRPDFGGQYFTFECDLIAPGFSDLAPATLAAMLKDCERCLNIEKYCDRIDDEYDPLSGQGLWADRQRGMCPEFPPLTLYLGDDGSVCLRETN